MPHKHIRRQASNGNSHFDLAPSSIAAPLPAFEKKTNARQNEDGAKKRKTKRKKAGGQKKDDTPREFARLMQYQTTKKRPSGLDDGEERKNKKRKISPSDSTSQPLIAAAQRKTDVPQILPGERLADYAARVDQALPVGGLTRKGARSMIEGIKERQTKTEKRLHKMYASWREEEARRKEKLEEQQELEQEEEDEKQAMYGGQDVELPTGRKGKRRRMVGETANDDDPWKVLKERRKVPKGLHDVVQAPPNFKAVPKEKFKIKNNAKVDVANVPATAGSLKRREELSDARRDVIECYRAMMKGN